jgi:endonuclease G
MKLFSILVLVLVSSSAFPFDRVDCGKHDDFGLPSESDFIICNDGFILGFNIEHKVADWVMYTTSAESIEPSFERPATFQPDELIDYREQATLNDYSHRGYDKGQLAPNATMDFSKQSQLDSFKLTNIAPQVPALNRQGWAELESLVRNCTIGSTFEVLVITGPIWNDKYEWLNDNVRIPSAYFKVLMERRSPFRMDAYIMPNAKVGRHEVSKYHTNVDEVEWLTGFDLFRLVPWTLQDKAEAGFNGFCAHRSLALEPLDIESNSSVSTVLERSINVLDKPINPYVCEVDKTCSTMTSCEEAKFYLNECGGSALDNDGNGLPCESICAN